MPENKVKVLVVEDEPIILQHTMKKVAELSDEIQVIAGVESAIEALALLEELSVDVLLTDIEMADMNGLELIRQVKENWPDTLTVILSGYDNFKYAQTALRYGVDDYLLKPIDLVQLTAVFERLRKIIKKHKTDDSASALPTEEIPLSLAAQIEGYLKENFDKNIATSDLVDQFSYAPSYISRVFKKKYDTSPMQYQTDLRIVEAKELLSKDPNLSIKEIAAIVGYEDARYFSRVFRQITGIAPSDWAKTAE